uniref:Uncharacterized protein n=1 Tax=Pipistrellus kuhlii TaxID=59472 RepID=A0A7J7RTF1_PIPKU|nr:hypothetical protein mPipKuh1_010247 [Pipistrellus kuhlii]
MPAFPRLYTRCGVRRAAPCEGQSYEGTQTSSVLPSPAPLQRRDCQARPGSANYISHNSVRRRHLGRWAVTAWGLALQTARSVLLTPILGLRHDGSGPRRVGRRGPGSSCPPSPLLTRGSRSTCRPRGETCSPPAGQRWRTGARAPTPPRRTSARHTGPLPSLSRRPVSAQWGQDSRVPMGHESRCPAPRTRAWGGPL